MANVTRIATGDMLLNWRITGQTGCQIDTGGMLDCEVLGLTGVNVQGRVVSPWVSQRRKERKDRMDRMEPCQLYDASTMSASPSRTSTR